MKPARISITVNGKARTVNAYPDEALLWALRDRLGLTGAKFGCGVGICGACSVLINGRRQTSCTVPVASLRARDEITTIEGLAEHGRLTKLQRAFIDNNGFACGFCTAGMIITAADLLRRRPTPSRKQIIKSMNDNICRCGCYLNIIESIQAASSRRRTAS